MIGHYGQRNDAFRLINKRRNAKSKYDAKKNNAISRIAKTNEQDSRDRKLSLQHSHKSNNWKIASVSHIEKDRQIYSSFVLYFYPIGWIRKWNIHIYPASSVVEFRK